MSAAFPEGTSDATAAAYFLHGLQAGLLSIEAAKEWAYEMIDLRETPSLNLIEVATANRVRDMETVLAVMTPDAKLDQAGRWLLKDIVQRLEDGEWECHQAINRAMQVAWATELPENIEWNGHGFLDGIYLAEQNIHGDISAVRHEALEFLRSECQDRKQYSHP